MVTFYFSIEIQWRLWIFDGCHFVMEWPKLMIQTAKSTELVAESVNAIHFTLILTDKFAR